jgi:hypothetical protein
MLLCCCSPLLLLLQLTAAYMPVVQVSDYRLIQLLTAHTGQAHLLCVADT